jgi:MtrB/PioB family decaheme-associated outer membrane protein
MKRMIFILLALPLSAPSLGLAEVRGELNLGARATEFVDDKSAKFDEYRDMSDGLFGSLELLDDSETRFIGATVENPALDDQFYEIRGGVFGLFKGEVYFDSLTHNLSRDARTPAGGFGSDFIVVPTAVPPVSAWAPVDFSVDVETLGANVTVDTQNPFYFKASVDQQRRDGITPYGLVIDSGLEGAMPIDYTTYTTLLETGYRSKETTAVLFAGYSQFDNDIDVLSTFNGVNLEEYSTPNDNYSYNFSGRLTQRLSPDSLLAVKAAYNANASETDFTKFLRIVSPFADNTFDGDVRYLRGNAVLTSRWSDMLDTRMFYNYVDRDNKSDEIVIITDEIRSGRLFEYDKHQGGLDANYRLSKVNKLTGGYELTYTDRTREDAETTLDNLLFAELKNTSLDWVSGKFRLEYLNRDTDTDFDEETLEGDGLINEFFTRVDYATKDRYKAKLAFEANPQERLALGLSYGIMFDDYDATMFGVQEDFRHEIYVDANYQLPKKARLNAFTGYEYTESDFDSRRFNPGGANPFAPPDANNFNWSQETSYDFFVVGASLNVPVMANLEMVFNVDYQVIDGNIDFVRAASIGAPLGTVTDADDYYKSRAGVKGIYDLDEQWSVTLGYGYEKSNLDDWKYSNYRFATPGFFLTGAGLDRDYEVHQAYLITTYRF